MRLSETAQKQNSTQPGGCGKAEIQKQDSHFPTAPIACGARKVIGECTPITRTQPMPNSEEAQSWTAKRICSLRNNHAIPVYHEEERQARGEMSVSEVADALGVTPTTVLRLIRLNQLPASQACMSAPWIPRTADVERCVAERNHPETPPMVDSAQLTLEIP